MNVLRLEKLLSNAANPSYSKALDQLHALSKSAQEIDYKITDGERGNWTHYYYCHHDAARLQFDWSSPKQHLCPVCSKTWTGEPFDAAWVTLAHSQLGIGMKHLALSCLIDDDIEALGKVKAVLLDYAQYYANYEIHGDIPYNGPGKLFAQTLDEAHWIIDICYAYRFVERMLTDEEKQLIRSGLLLPCAEFLIEHKEKQLHNHAVLITSAIAMLGFLLEDEAIHLAGLKGEYGLLDQIDRGVLADGMWYEGAFQYHFYGYHSLLQYAILVEHTEWDLKAHPTLKKMFDFPLGYILPDGTLPNLNDASYTANIQRLAPYYEIAFDWYGDARYGELLRLAYGFSNPNEEQKDSDPFSERNVQQSWKATSDAPVDRDSLEALWFGEELDNGQHEKTSAAQDAATGDRSLAQLLMSDTTSDASGLTKLVNRKGWHLLIKHSKFGGEHDHMDRLGLSFGAGSVPLFIDPGTTAYGVPAHYGWFKHTYSHNTVSINGKDQPPADGKRLQYHQEHWGSWIESAVEWNDSAYTVKDSIILPEEMCPWDDQAYDGVSLRRVNMVTEHLLLDMVKVTVPDERTIDLLYHLSGELADNSLWQPSDAELSELGEHWLQDKMSKQLVAGQHLEWKMREGMLQQVSWCSNPVQLITASTVDNPPNRSRQTLVQRVSGSREREVLFINAFSYNNKMDRQGQISGHLKLNAGTKSDDSLLLELTLSDVELSFTLDWNGEQAVLEQVK
ncbi:heparinase II/III family protein [Paenibacillus radicis (ex Xue et al. 2023)]|uniref:Heparinase II/III family protein n=1 Tax=Paenibacillus radicis (ex Xue et al. 2023) TaxID=2972489 RepID=A0ABT1YMJ2_9BACL|nr:heparinase II/III family protein [Paenibacillus radicis (ex Xue et al. 2023)]MCR8634381.1 heparinase II/III family protein [Paenibacillus radicis (ex Xue et al. 2023)]